MTSWSINGIHAGSDGGGLFVASVDKLISKSKLVGNQALNVGGISELKGKLRVLDGSEVNGN